MQHAYVQDRRAMMKQPTEQVQAPVSYEAQRAASHWVVYAVFALIAMGLTILSTQPGIEKAVGGLFR